MNAYSRELMLSPSEIDEGVLVVDYYLIEDLYNMPGRIGHAVKKLLCAGNRGSKPTKQDYEEAIRSIQLHIKKMDRDDSIARIAL